MIIKCGECGLRVEAYDTIAFVRDGWVFATLIGGGLGWICPSCAKKHQKIIEKIQKGYGL